MASGEPSPIPTLPLNLASLTVPSSTTSILGIPETSFTEKNVPDKSFDTENNCPAEPSKLNVEFDPSNSVVKLISSVGDPSTSLNVMLSTLSVSALILPTTSNFSDGVVVPIPTPPPAAVCSINILIPEVLNN